MKHSLEQTICKTRFVAWSAKTSFAYASCVQPALAPQVLELFIRENTPVSVPLGGTAHRPLVSSPRGTAFFPLQRKRAALLYSRFALAFCLAAILCLGGGCAIKRQSAAQPVAGLLIDAQSNPVDTETLLTLAGQADYILVGERHDSPLDHHVQAQLVSTLASGGLNPIVGLEMLPARTYDPVLAEFISGRTSLPELAYDLHWGVTWGYDFGLYQPVFAVARDHGVPLRGLNIPNALRKSVSERGLAALTHEQRRELPSAIIPPLDVQREELASFFKMHSAMLAEARAKRAAASSTRAAGDSGPSPQSNASHPVVKPRNVMKPSVTHGQRFERFLLIQSLWDSAMAERASELRHKPLPTSSSDQSYPRPVVILAGSGHVTHGYGIAHRLRHFDPHARILSVVPFFGPAPDPSAGDLFFHSPAPGGMSGK